MWWLRRRRDLWTTTAKWTLHLLLHCVGGGGVWLCILLWLSSAVGRGRGFVQYCVNNKIIRSRKFSELKNWLHSRTKYVNHFNHRTVSKLLKINQAFQAGHRESVRTVNLHFSSYSDPKSDVVEVAAAAVAAAVVAALPGNAATAALANLLPATTLKLCWRSK